MKIHHQLGRASGASLGSCAFLAYRCDARFGLDPSHMESWVLSARGGEVATLLSTAGWFSGIHCSDSGTVIAIDVAGRVHVHDASAAAMGMSPWQTFDLSAALGGIWGFSDELAFVWGKSGAADVMFRWDGARFHAMESPGPVMAMHGYAKDAIYAAGEEGLVARWDGARWHRFDPPTRWALWDVHARPEGVTVCGPFAGVLAFGPEGWATRADASVAPECVAWWHDALWVGSAEGGLLRVGDAEVGNVEGVRARRLDARDALLVSCDEVVLGSTDGASFASIPVGAFTAAATDQPLRWNVEPEDDPLSLEGDVDIDED